MPSKKYLVTGGTGFIGAALVRRLVETGYSVRSFDNDSRGAARRLSDLKGDLELIQGDIRDAEAVMRAAQGMEGIIHLAYINGTEYFYSKPKLVLDVAVRGMLSVLDASKKHGIREFILASSSEVYQTPPHVPTDESAPLTIPDVFNPRYSYGGGKMLCELMAIHYGRTDFDRMMIFRPHNVYGPDMGWEHVVPQFIVRAIDSIRSTPEGLVPFLIQGDGTQMRSFTYIDDFVDGLMLLVEKGANQGLYHIGTQDEVKIQDLARKILHYFGREARFIQGAASPGGTARRCPDIRKLEALGFQPKINMETGLKRTIEWYEKHLDLRPRRD